MGVDYITFAGKSSKDFSAYIYDSAGQTLPEREYETVSIPGRSGELLISKDRMANVTKEYTAVFSQPEAMANKDNMLSYLLSFTGYQRLESSFETDCYRMAKFAGGSEFKTDRLRSIAVVPLSFECKPQKWLLSGEKGVETTAAITLKNPTFFDAKPLIRVYGYGDLTVGSRKLTLSAHTQAYMDIDCELCECSCGSVNLNAYCKAASTADDNFPVLARGEETKVAFTSTITKIIVTPRWWKI